jgi:hypothetical protein
MFEIMLYKKSITKNWDTSEMLFKRLKQLRLQFISNNFDLLLPRKPDFLN